MTDISKRLRAMASDWLRSSEPTPGYAPGVSMNVMSGRRNRSGEPHETQRLAITLGLRHAVVAAHALLGVATLLVADEHHGSVVETRGAADDGEVVAVHAVAVQFVEVLEDEPGVVERVGDAADAGRAG
jgi:hypothetical protein